MSNIDYIYYYLMPSVAFFIILFLETTQENIKQTGEYSGIDYGLNMLGFFIQGVIVPIVGLQISYLLPYFLGQGGALKVGWTGAFLINFFFIDLLYYGQHYLLHKNDYLWRLHLCHHSSPKLSVWATSRNNIFINLLFVYFLINPVFIFLCDKPDGFIFSAMITASLDLFRHSCVKLADNSLVKYLGYIFVMPAHHHRHHDATDNMCNFGANLIIWDKMFGTFKHPKDNIKYKYGGNESVAKQLLYPVYTSK